VVREGGFTQAATQSTVSKAIKQLENEIGVPLLTESATAANRPPR
jgi:DNA-binding transcriptional LysR family regulator